MRAEDGFVLTVALASLHHEEFVGHNVGLSLVQNAPGILGITSHDVVEGAPEVLRLLRSCGSRGSGELTISIWIHFFSGITILLKICFTFMNRVWTFGTKEPKGVITENVRIGQNLVISKILSMRLNSKVSVTLKGFSHLGTPSHGTVKQCFKLEGIII
jgi:hypothetical protein